MFVVIPPEVIMAFDANSERPRRRTGRIVGWKFSLLVVFAILLGGDIAAMSLRPSVRLDDSDFVTIQPDTFQEMMTSRGTLEAISSRRVHSECHWTVSILSLVPEGTWVEEGDIVCVLDSAEIEEFLRSREISLIKANAAVTASLKQEEIQRAAAERRLSDAKYALQTAEFELQEYIDGKYPQQIQQLQKNIDVTEVQSETASDDLRFISRMWMMGMANRAERDAASLVATSQTEQLRRLQTQQQLLEKYTHPKIERQLKYRVDNYRLGLVRTELTNSLIETRTKMNALADERRLQIYERYAASAKESIAACTMRAPRAGRVIHANNWYLRSRGIRTIEEGKSVYFSQPIFEIPDESEFKVSFPVDEALITKVSQGMPVEVRLTGYEDDVVAGTVTSIPMYARTRSPYGTEIKEYWLEATLHPTDAQWQNMHPQMDADVTFAITNLPNAISVPRSSVVREGSQTFVWLQHGESLMKCAVRAGTIANDKVVILSGLHPGDRIVQDPQSAVGLLRQDNGGKPGDGRLSPPGLTDSLAVSGNSFRG